MSTQDVLLVQIYSVNSTRQLIDLYPVRSGTPEVGEIKKESEVWIIQILNRLNDNSKYIDWKDHLTGPQARGESWPDDWEILGEARKANFFA